MDLSLVRAVLFDAVGTLIYPQPPVVEAYAAAGARHGSRYLAQDIRTRFRDAVGHIAQRMPSQSSEELERWRWQRIVAEVFADVPDATGPLFTELWEHFAQGENWAVFGDVAPLWEELERREVTIGIASNFDGRLVSVCAHHSPLDECRHVFYSSAVGHSKPSQEFFHYIANRLRLAPHELLLIGDDARHDLAGAREAGWQALLVDRTISASGGHTLNDLRDRMSLLTSPNERG